jgi:3',5'-cyclic AMP phosphodiesterase CpdA
VKNRLSTLSLSVLVLASSCTNFQFNPVGSRFSENQSSSLTSPANLDLPGTNQFQFAVMGDSHIGNPGGEVFKLALARAKSDGVQLVLVAGDVSDNGDLGQYRQFKTLLAQQNMPYAAALGNHDIFFDGWKNFKLELGKSAYTFDVDSTHFVVLDTANGVIGEEQLTWLENDLKNHANDVVFIMTHFPPWNGYFSSIFKLSSDEEAAILKDMMYRYNVDAVFSGHYHGFRQIRIGNTEFFVTGAANDLNDPGEKQHYIRVNVNGSNVTYRKVDLN